MWKCYTKAVSSAHMLLTFLPASYDDLLLLNKQEEEAEGESGGEEKKVGACVCEPVTSTQEFNVEAVFVWYRGKVAKAQLCDSSLTSTLAHGWYLCYCWS